MLNLFDYENAARELIEPAAFGYQVGGANDEITVRENRRAWDDIAVRHRTMVDVSTRSLATTVLGTPVSMPVLVAPTAMQKLAHPDGEIGMARAAEQAETLMIVSTTATIGLAEVAASTPAPKWFQVYIYQSREYTRRLVERAVGAGYKALVLTVDAPMLGRRERDIRNGFTLPRGLHIANAEISGMEVVPDATADASGLMQHFRGLHDPSLTPKDIAWLRDLSGLPIVVKGIVRGDDAVRAMEHGASAIVVSNHGGRQLDTSVATARVLAEVVAAVGRSGRGVRGRGGPSRDRRPQGPRVRRARGAPRAAAGVGARRGRHRRCPSRPRPDPGGTRPRHGPRRVSIGGRDHAGPHCPLRGWFILRVASERHARPSDATSHPQVHCP